MTRRPIRRCGRMSICLVRAFDAVDIDTFKTEREDQHPLCYVPPVYLHVRDKTQSLIVLIP